jgi:hypothetical protein
MVHLGRSWDCLCTFMSLLSLNISGHSGHLIVLSFPDFFPVLTFLDLASSELEYFIDEAPEVDEGSRLASHGGRTTKLGTVCEAGTGVVGSNSTKGVGTTSTTMLNMI